MKSLRTLWFSVLVVSGCSSVQIYTPTARNQTPTPAEGHIVPLRDSVKSDQTLTVIFVHGVGDHCRGYAVGDENPSQESEHPWLDQQTLQHIRLHTVPNSQKDWQITAAEIGIGAPWDASENVTLVREMDFMWDLSEHQVPLKVHAIEITWSPLTRWIKNTLLGFDAANYSFLLHAKDKSVTACDGDKDDAIGQMGPLLDSFGPPPRVTANGSLKWQLLDRSLADALIYAGTYGDAINRAISEALCVALQPQNPNRPCTWNSTAGTGPGHVIFVTHSLGSRILYDTLLHLSNNPVSAPAVTNVIRRTAGFYMMANQVALFGTARVPIGAQFNRPSNYLQIEDPNEPSSSAPEGAGLGPTEIAEQLASDPLLQILRLASKLAAPNTTLPVVSFNDTNDLLTWHLPSWYRVDALPGKAEIELTDVFISNAPKFLGVVEWPPTAHGGYFANSLVWEAIYCGADKGHINSCR